MSAPEVLAARRALADAIEALGVQDGERGVRIRLDRHPGADRCVVELEARDEQGGTPIYCVVSIDPATPAICELGHLVGIVQALEQWLASSARPQLTVVKGGASRRPRRRRERTSA